MRRQESEVSEYALRICPPVKTSWSKRVVGTKSPERPNWKRNISSTMRHQHHFSGANKRCKQRPATPMSQCIGSVAWPKREYVPHLKGTKFSRYCGTGQCISRKSSVELSATFAAATAQSMADPC